MIRIATALVIVAALAGCGHGSASSSTRPPAAFVTTGAGTHRLTLGSYCWTAASGSGSVTGCGDSGDPARYPGLARTRAERGETIVIRFGFTPTKPVTASIGARRYRLPAEATVRLRVRAGGLLEIDASRGSDDASYYAHVRVAG
jgi:hypothetical protein